jgi:transposase
VLEGHFELIVGNARHMRNVPGRKTDVKDAEWIAELVCCGLVRSSFVPSKPLRELRELLRYRRKLVEAQAAERNRLQKLLETSQHQARQRRNRRVRRLWPGHPAGAAR